MRAGGWSFTGCSLSFDSVHIKETTQHFSAGPREAQEYCESSQRLTKNTDCSEIPAVPLDSFHGLTGSLKSCDLGMRVKT